VTAKPFGSEFAYLILVAYGQRGGGEELSDESEKEQLRQQVDELRRALRWERTQKERLIEDLGASRRENQRLRATVAELDGQQEKTAL
jgi:hypothetical protein